MSLLQFRRLLLAVCSAFISVLANAQSIDDFSQNNIWSNVTTIDPSEYSIEIETLATDIGPLADDDLTGFNCYQLFVTMGNPNDKLSAVFGNESSPAQLLTTGNFFQSSPLGSVTSAGVIEGAWPSYPSNEYDSYVTIGIDGPPSSANGEGEVLTVQSSTNPWKPLFEPGSGALGSGFSLTDNTGGTWFTQASYTNGNADSNQRVLIAQLTTNGVLSGNLHVQIFFKAIKAQRFISTWPYPHSDAPMKQRATMTQALPKTMAAALSSMFVETAEEKASQPETAIVTETNSTPSATVEAIAQPTPTVMASATT